MFFWAVVLGAMTVGAFHPQPVKKAEHATVKAVKTTAKATGHAVKAVGEFFVK